MTLIILEPPLKGLELRLKEEEFMRGFLLNSMFLASIGVMSNSVAAPVSVSVPVDHIYVPKGFDTNDNTQVIVTGYLPNLCYKSPSSTVSVTENNISIQLNALFEAPANGVCAEAIVPYMEVVSVGVLAEGTYGIKVNEGASAFLEESVSIVQSPSLDINDHIYAAVDYVERKENTRTVILNGYNPSDCFELSEVKFISNDKDTFAVLPIMKKIRSFCPMKMIPFKYEAEVPADLKAETLLLHVRVMSGDSVNSLFDNKQTIE